MPARSDAVRPEVGRPDPERLIGLEQRLAAARARRAPAPRQEEHYSQANMAWRMVTELVAGIGLGVAIGLGLDALAGTRPLFLVVFTLLGFVAGVRVMLRTAQEIGRDAPGSEAGAFPREGETVRDGA